MGSAIPASGVDVRIKGRVTVKALELQLALQSPASDFSVVILTQAGPLEASRLLSSGNGTVCPRRPAQAPGSLIHLFAAGLLYCSSWRVQGKKVSRKRALWASKFFFKCVFPPPRPHQPPGAAAPAPVSAQTHLLLKSVLSSPGAFSQRLPQLHLLQASTNLLPICTHPPKFKKIGMKTG